MIRKTAFAFLCFLSLSARGVDNTNCDNMHDNVIADLPQEDLISSPLNQENLIELIENTDTVILEKDLEKFPIEEELFNQDPFSELGFDDADMESLDEILKNQNIEPQPPSKLIRFLSKGYPLFSYVMRCKRSFTNKCTELHEHIIFRIKAFRKKISCS